MDITRLTLSVMDTNVYLLEFDDGIIVIDPADDPDAILRAAVAKDKPIKYVLITHGHFDHCNAAYKLQRAGAQVYMSEIDFEMIENGFDLARYCGTHFNIFKPDCFAVEGELELLGAKIEVLSTPGHTEGGLTYIFGENIFCGDTLFYLSIGRADLPTGDKKALTQSVKKLYALSGNYTVYPGHGEPTTLDYERKYNPYVRL